ncbi:MAG: hypothetical protein JW807_03515 [Spirochaetes bacterium]|nr:hypothetical protein [Spirochaetota bacterium]
MRNLASIGNALDRNVPSCYLIHMGIFNNKKTGGDDYSPVIREFKMIRMGDPVPREGACSFFYQHLTYAGQTLALNDGRKYYFFHVENDDVVQEILSGVASWQVFTDDGRIIVSILFKTGKAINRIQLTIDPNISESARILKFLRGQKKIEINVLNMVYGHIVKEKTISVQMPKNIADKIKKAAG